MKRERICKECGYRAVYDGFDSQKFCPHDGDRLRDYLLFTDGGGTEIFINKHKEDNLTCFGTHFKCGGYVYERTSSDDRRVLSCHACYLRFKMPKAWERNKTC